MGTHSDTGVTDTDTETGADRTDSGSRSFFEGAEYFTVQSLARHLGLSPTWVYGTPWLPGGFKIGRRRVFRRADIEQWIAAGCPRPDDAR